MIKRFYYLVTVFCLLSFFFGFIGITNVYSYYNCEESASGQTCCAAYGQVCDGYTQDCSLGPYNCTNVCTGYSNGCVSYTECNSSCFASAPTPSSTLPFCGDGTCSSGPSGCATCPIDCGACATSAPAPTAAPGNTEQQAASGGGSGATSGCGDGFCGAGETCSTCPGECGICSGAFCGDGTCNAGESCNTCTADCGACTCGNGVCGAGETCSTCAADCGACAAAASCGDGSCNGFESCITCTADCGACSTAWWQASNGNVFAGQTSGAAIISNISASTCTGSCVAQLITRDSDNTAESYGYPITGGGGYAVNGYYNEGSIKVSGTSLSRYIENYDFFYRSYSLGLSPCDDFSNNATDATKPTEVPCGSKAAYFHSGDLTISQAWNIADTENIVVFVDGNLTLTDPNNLGQLITVADGGFVAFIVSGNIEVDQTLGNAVGSTAHNLEGVYIADGTLTIGSTGNTSTEQRFVGAGIFAGITDVVLDRDLGLPNNNTVPAELFVYQPNLVFDAPDEMLRPQYLWQETY